MVQMEPPGFRKINDIVEEKNRVQTMLARLQNVIKLRGSNQMRTETNLANNQPIQLADIN